METLKENEIRIGNWVHIRQTKNNEQIGGIEENGRFLTKGYKSSYSSIECLEPIPITEEWLVKLGFEKEYNFFQKYISNIESLSWSEESGLALHRRRIGNTHIFRHIKHVHTLQNLVHALTGNELTIKS